MALTDATYEQGDVFANVCPGASGLGVAVADPYVVGGALVTTPVVIAV